MKFGPAQEWLMKSTDQIGPDANYECLGYDNRKQEPK
jgi:hypothetical protein